MPPRVPDEYVLLCERCGYEIEGLPAEANCPECGRPVAESLPEQRPGTRWQRAGGSIGSLIPTWADVLRRPARVFDSAVPASLHSELLGTTVLAAGSMVAIYVLVFLWADTMIRVSRLRGTQVIHAGPLWMEILIAVAIGLMAVPAVTLLLTWIEKRGIRFWGPRRGWRITPAIAKVICAHASVGWLVGSVLAVIGHALGWILSDMTNRGNYGILRGPMQLAPISLPAIALIAGMLHFEILVYIGMTRMKFANRPRPAPLDASVPPASVPSPPSSEA